MYIKSLIKKYRRKSVILVLLVTVCNIFALLYNYSYKFVIDSITSGLISQAFKNFVFLVLCMIGVNVFTLIVYDYFLKIFQKRVEADVRKDVLEKVVSFDYEKSKHISQGNITTMISSDASQIGEYVSLYYFMIVANTIRFIITYAMLFTLDSFVGFVVLFSLPLYYISTKFTLKPMKRFVKEGYESRDTVNQNFLDVLKNLISIKSYNIEERINGQIIKNNEILYSKEKSLNKWMAIFYFLRNFVTSFMPVLLLGISIVRISRGDMTLGSLVAILGFLDAVYLPMDELFQFKAMDNNLDPVRDRMDSLFNEDNTFRNQIVKQSKDMAVGVSNLSYYINGKNILKDINFEIEEPGLYRLTGENGSGKSTLLNVIMGLYNDFEGNVRINSPDKKITYMNQFDYLFDTDLDNNISLFNKFKIEESSFNLMKSLPKGEVKNYSGGEKRFALFIRAINTQADIYLLDEPFEGVDSFKKLQMIDILNKLAKEKIVIIVSHDDDDFKDLDYQIIEI